MLARIAGRADAGSGLEREALVHRMLRGTLPSATEEAVLSDGPASLGAVALRGRALMARGRLVVAFDGSVYNRDELGKAGASDAERVAELWAREGPAALPRINGDFALAVWDAAEETLWLARDRFGVRPLYHARAGEGVAFASRPRSLLRVPGVRRSVRRDFLARFAASHYRTFDNDPQASPFEDIHQVPAAHVARVRGAAFDVRPYWSVHDAPDLDGSDEELAARYRALLLDAVRLRLESVEDPAFLLSGGMDSSSVVACATKVTGEPAEAFTSVYDDKAFDESEDVRPMLAAGLARWHPVAVGEPDVFGLVERMVRAHDEPVATATWLAHLLVCEEAASRGAGALLGGLGGDELNAGEYEHFTYHFADLRAEGREAEFAAEVEAWARHHDHPVHRKGRAIAEQNLARLTDPSEPGRCRPDRARIERYARALAPGFFDLQGYEPAMDHPFRSALKNRTWQDLSRETLPCCLRAEDRHSALFGLEHVDPFLDHRIVEFMFRVQGDRKIRDGVTKRLLRAAMRGLLPEETRTRVKKTGWNAPAHRWFTGPGKERLLALVEDPRFQARGIYDLAEVRRLIEEHDAIVRSGALRENHGMFLWQLVNLELWLRSLEDDDAA